MAKLDKTNKDFIDAHATMMRHPDKYKIDYFPGNGEDLRFVREQMVQRFKQTQMRFELEMFWDKKQWSDDSDFWAWFGASRERTALFHAFNLNEHPDGWSVSSMSNFVGRDRSSVSRELTECHSLGFIYRNKAEDKQRLYLPTARLLNNGTWYCEYFVDKQLAMDDLADRSLFFEYRKTERKYLNTKNDNSKN